MKDKFKYKGWVIITNKNTNESVRYENIVTNKFYEMVADFMAGSSPDKMSHIAIGIGTTAVAVTQTALVNESFRKAITTTATPDSQIHLQTEITGAEALFVWKEIGIFNAASAGDMTNRVLVDYTHNAGEAIVIDYYIEPVV
jgi:uncharacterized 2Fe-2S/4Fe-4S cluster protein (DUF4445 family)